jgi:tryptophan synthase beta subunit
MSRTLCKICGLVRPDDCLAVNAAQPDFAGFVFAKSRRQVTPAQAAALVKLLLPGILPVGVFVAATEETIASTAEAAGLRAVQLHDDFAPGRIARLRQRLASGTAIWQRLAVPLDQPAEAALAAARKIVAAAAGTAGAAIAATGPKATAPDLPDLWLLDSCKPAQAGGTGEPFNWAVFRAFCAEVPVVLAGGLSPANVSEALSTLLPAVVDCSSGVETAGRKDPQLVRQFCERVQQFNKSMDPASQAGPNDQREGIPMIEIRTAEGKPAASRTASQPVFAGPHLPDARGRYGYYGGRFAAETLMPALAELEKAYGDAQADPSFQQEYRQLLLNYAGRPSLLYKADRISRELGLPVYLKREDLNHTGAHKINNVLGQILLARRMGKRHVIAETGAGQHGVATATVAALFGLDCDVFMGEEDTRRQALNVYRMELLGAKVHSVSSGTGTLKDATSEAMREWARRADDTFYVIGSTMGPHPYPMIVRDFQRVIGDEIKSQMLAECGRLPGTLIACVGGGSNAMGTFYPFLNDMSVRLIGAEAGGEGVASGRHAATMTAGKLGVFHGMHSLFLQDEDGQIQPVYSISAGLDYPGIGPEHVYLQETRRAEYAAVTDREAVAAFGWLARLEGIIPAIESAHALALLRRLAADGSLNPNEPVVVTVSGRGDKDVAAIQVWEREHAVACGFSEQNGRTEE